MPDSSGTPVVFISYSQKDRVWLDYVRSFFAPLARQYGILVFDDEKLQIGGDWRADIYSALDACDVFIVLVSRYSLASDFILDEEIPRIRERLKGEVWLCPILVTPYEVLDSFEWLDKTTRRPRNNKALSELLDPARDREMSEIVVQIAGRLRALPTTSSETAPPRAKAARPPNKAAAFPSIVDYGRLAESPYNRLVGRDEELQRLDDAWDDDRIRIISLVAWGGAGKTSLVIEWLTRVRNDGYRNADAVLGWSFFSQGTSTRRSASGEGFLDWALRKLQVKIDTTSESAKGERLAEEFARRRVLLMLDGLEPLQFGPEGQRGALKDQGLRSFLRGLALGPPMAARSLVVLTSRLAVYDLRKWQGTTSPLIDLGRLSGEAGAVLLADGGANGSVEALHRAAVDFDGHALALSLLAGYLRQLHGGDVSQRARIRASKHDADASGHDQARRVIEAFERDWLLREPRMLSILHMVGLFDRPARADCIAALRSRPVIEGFNDSVVDLDEAAWTVAIAQLRAVRLLAPEDASAPDTIDAHPLVREWFGEELRRENEAAWKAAHSRLFDHLRNSTSEGIEPTLEDLAPLYQALAHGCRAGRYQEAIEKVYRDRICQLHLDGTPKFYSMHRLHAYGSDLAAISWFFEGDYGLPLGALPPPARAWIVSIASSCLIALDRPMEALSAQRVGLQLEQTAGDRTNIPVSMANICMGELATGQIAAAVATGERAIALADAGTRLDAPVINRVVYADALGALGDLEAARRMFIEAEQRQAGLAKNYPQQEYMHSKLLLEEHKYAAVKERASRTLPWAKARGFLVDIALTTLMRGRASLGLVLSSPPNAGRSRYWAREAKVQIEAALEGLRGTGVGSHVLNGLLARAAFRRSAGDWDNAARDLDEAEEVAEPGSMKLFLCDTALERTRLALAQIEACAPLNGLPHDSPPKPNLPGADEARRLKTDATRHLVIAADFIEACGYHRRDEELAELQAVLRGERKFADLPPRV